MIPLLLISLPKFELSPLAQNCILSLGLILIISSIFISMRKRRRNASTRVTAREHVERLKQKHAIKNDLESTMVEIEELGKRLSSQLDSKTIALEKAIEDAELRIIQLNQLINSAQHTTPPSPSQPPIPNPPQQPQSTQPPSPTPQPLLSTTDIRQSDPDLICRLADQGLSAQQISQKTGELLGKIELILALREAT